MSDTDTSPATSFITPVGVPHPEMEGGNKDFNDAIGKANQDESKWRDDKALSAEEYFTKQQEREKQLLEDLKKFKDEELSLEQRMEREAITKEVGFNDRNRQIEQNYRDNPNDAKAKAAHDQLHADFTEYRHAIENDPEFQGYASVAKLKELDARLAQEKDPAKQKEIARELSEAGRSFIQEETHDPKGEQKYVDFVEHNKNLAVIKDSGMLDASHALEQHDHLKAIGYEEVKPNGPAQAGSVVNVTYKDDQGRDVTVKTDAKTGATVAYEKDHDNELHAEKAGTVVTATGYDKDGHQQTQQKYTVAHADGVMTPQTPAGGGGIQQNQPVR